MMDSPRDKEISELLAKVAAMMAEHVDSVQIVVTYKDERGTSAWLADGAGGPYERRGACAAWMRWEDAYEAGRAAELGRQSARPPEDGDEWKGGAL